jgi:hypothetical protein
VSVSTKLLCKVAMPYDGGSVTGLINLLNEVAVPHKIMQPMAYSAPVIAEAKHQRLYWGRIFFFFSPAPKTGWEKEKYRSIVKELIYRTISFFSNLSPFCIPHRHPW